VGVPVTYRATVQDQYGNTVTAASPALSFAVGGIEGGFTPPTVTASEGVATSSFTASTSGTATVTVSAEGLAAASASLSVVAQTTVSVRVNGGGGAYTDSSNNNWSADTGFTGGQTFTASSGIAIAATADPTLYRSERWGNFSYALNVPNGSYTLRLHFAEIFFTTPGQRRFNVVAEGEQILANYDIVADAGGANRAVIRTFPINISDGRLDLSFTGVVDNAKISAVELVPAGQTATLVKVSGDSQTGAAGTALAQPLVVLVRDAAGVPQAGASVGFSITAGGGSLSTTTATTDANGRASTVLTLGTVAGNNTVSAAVAGVGSVTFGATATPAAPAQLSIVPAIATDGIGIPLSYQVRIRDQFGNIVTTASNVISLTVSGVNGTFAPAQAAASAGVLNSQFTPSTSGTATITASATGLTPATATLTVSQTGGSNQTVFTTQTPALPNVTDNTAYELGMKFRSSQAGQVTAIRYWRAQSETGNHVGRIWAANGTLLASVQFGSETASGWQTQTLPTPLAIQANTTYVVSVNTNTHYAFTNAGLAQPITNSDLSSVADGNNGVFGSPGTFPTSSFQNSNYFRDVVFTADSGTVSSALSLFSGNNQTAAVGTALPQPLVVQVRDGQGNPQAGVSVGFSVIAGNGTLSSTTATTDANGRASTALTLGTTAGAVTVTAASAGLGSVTFSASALPGVATQLVLNPTDAALSFGANLTYQAILRDQFGNTATGAGGVVAFSATGLNGTFAPIEAAVTAGLATTVFTPATTGTATITATTAGLNAAQANLNVVLAARINAGGGTYTDGLANTWSADTGFSGGNAFQSNNQISLTADPTLYQSERWGNAFGYTINLPNGNYTLRLHFAEIFFGSPGQRVFNVSAQGNQILSNYDIVADVGGSNRAVIKSFPVTVSNGQLTVNFISVVDNAKVSAIEVVPAGQVPTISKVSGDNQTATVGTALPQPLVVQVLNSTGAPQAGVTVLFEVLSGNGSLLTTSALTDASGQASTVLTLGTRAGLNSVRASASGIDGIIFAATANPGAPVKLGLTPTSTSVPTATAVAYQASIQDEYGNTVTTAPPTTVSVSVSGVAGSFSTTTPLTSGGVASSTFTPTSNGTATLTATASGLGAATAKLVVAAPNGIVLENRQPGTTDWKIATQNQAVASQIEGYADATSVNKGGSINFKISLGTPGNYTIEVFRLGYYGGAGGRRLTTIGPRTGTTQPACGVTDQTTRLVECNWSTSYTLTVPDTWTTGIYLAKLTAQATNRQTYIWFVVRDDASPAKMLYQSAFTTYIAYNGYGGYSTYFFNSVNQQRAFKVSLDRPFDQTLGVGEFNNILRWEYNMVRWLESQGYDLAYATNLDFETNPGLLNNRQVFLSVGHDEYWSLTQRNAVEAARDAGKHLAFLSANTAYWRIRFENSTLTSQPNRVMVTYKEDFALDPVAPTTLWRDPANNRPENALLGVMYIGNNSAVYGGDDFSVINSSDPYFANTGVSDGSTFKQLVGFEWDAIVDNGFTPEGLVILGQSVVNATASAPGVPFTPTQISHAVRYTALSGGKVFSTGSIQWAWGLDSDGVSPPRADDRVRQMTVNIFADMDVLPQTPANTLVLP
jgi:5-hydroxyisourate hydrolase-like protein (transthyretin family)